MTTTQPAVAEGVPLDPPEPAEPPSPLPSASPLDRAFLTNRAGVTTLLLIRHGKQHFPERDRPTAADWVNPPLSETGVRQAAALGRALARERLDVIYSSPLTRALDTARAVAQHHGFPPIVVPELREIELFREVPDGLNLTDLIGFDELRQLQERFIHERRWDIYPYSEPSAEFRGRVLPAIDEIVARHPGQRVAVACHGGVANCYLGHVLGLAEDMFFRPAHGSINRVLAAGDRRVIHSLNETHHLTEVDPALLTV